MREAARVALLVAAVACFVLSLTYQSSVEKTPGGEVRSYTVGLASSPWFEKTVEDRPNGHSERSRMTPWCWSAAVMLAGALLLGVRNVLERPAPQTPPEGSGGAP